jgi:aryl-alcohol dehydrogenase-like predicted oxidoreductase
MSKERLQASLDFCKQQNLPHYETLQPEYNLYSRETFEREYAPICLQEGISVIPYFSLASGFLTGKYRSETDLGKSVRGGGMTKYLNERGSRILQALDAVAQRCNTRPATVALAWLLAQPHIAAPIASATTVQQLQELTEAAHLRLDEEALLQLNDASRY